MQKEERKGVVLPPGIFFLQTPGLKLAKTHRSKKKYAKHVSRYAERRIARCKLTERDILPHNPQDKLDIKIEGMI